MKKLASFLYVDTVQNRFASAKSFDYTVAPLNNEFLYANIN